VLVGEAEAEELAGVVGEAGEPGGVGDEAAGVEAAAVDAGVCSVGMPPGTAMGTTEMRPDSLPSPTTGGIRAATRSRFSRAPLSAGAAKRTASK
jgi:hypothetical protein